MKKEETYTPIGKENTVKCNTTPPMTTFVVGLTYPKNELVDLYPGYFDAYAFTTEDGVDYYNDGDIYYYVVKDATRDVIFEQPTNRQFLLSDNVVRFSTREKAQAHIDEKNKPKFEAGKVYKTDMLGGSLFFCTEFSNGAGKGYGFEDGKWISETGNTFYWSFRDDKNPAEATPDEWEAALIKEAERRGFKEGVKFIPVSKNALGDEFGTVGKMNKNIFDYFSEEVSGGLASMKNWVMRHGKWASIIPEPEKEKTTAEWIREYKDSDMGLCEFVKKYNLIITKAPSHA